MSFTKEQYDAFPGNFIPANVPLSPRLQLLSSIAEDAVAEELSACLQRYGLRLFGRALARALSGDVQRSREPRIPPPPEPLRRPGL